MLRSLSSSPSPPPPPLPTTLPGGPDALNLEAQPGASCVPDPIHVVEIFNATWPSFPTVEPPDRLCRRLLGGGHVEIRVVSDGQAGAVAVPVEQTMDMAGVEAPPPGEATVGPALEAVRSGQALAAAWQETLREWTTQVAVGLRMEGLVRGDASGVPALPHYEKLARECFRYDLDKIVSSEELRRLLPLHKPLPQALRDAVLEAADVEVIDHGRLDDEQIEVANLALTEIYCQLQQPAARALIEGKLGQLFAALHARCRPVA